MGSINFIFVFDSLILTSIPFSQVLLGSVLDRIESKYTHYNKQTRYTIIMIDPKRAISKIISCVNEPRYQGVLIMLTAAIGF
jgi:hypothetical protein